jgi:hypothetical protein
VRTYYRGPDAVVTDELFVWQAGARRAFVVAELRDVGWVRDVGIRIGRIVAAVLLAVAGAAWVLLVLLARWYVGLSALVVAVAVRRWPPHTRSWALRAAYRGDTAVTFYTSADARVFHQVCRALRRAMENARPRP